jgi:hypothetical protein
MGTAGAGPKDYLDLGNWNAICSMCGAKFKASELMQHWQGMWRCSKCWEPRHPQDFVRGVPDNMTPPWVQSRVVAYAAVPDQIATESPTYTAEPSLLATEDGDLIITEG